MLQIRDIKRGLIYLQSHPEILDLTGRSIFLSGHSSGAHITSLLLLREAQRPRRGLEEQIPPIAAFIGFSGVYDVGAHYEYEGKARVCMTAKAYIQINRRSDLKGDAGPICCEI
jgi:acetyl esterase/lipase